MFFVISKLAGSLILPSNALTVLAALGVILVIVRKRRAGVGAMIVSAIMLVSAGWLPLGNDALRVLENRFPQPALPDHVTGIVMLGGAAEPNISADRKTVALNDAAERITAVAALSRRYPQARIILSGGIGYLLGSRDKTESAYARDVLVSIGVPADRIEMEQKSRNTFENAVDSKALAKPKPTDVWLMVTSANHMPRAVGCFRKAGFPVTPYPVDYRTETPIRWMPTSSIAKGLTAADKAVHEWVGLLAYHFAKGTELFPAPAQGGPEQP